MRIRSAVIGLAAVSIGVAAYLVIYRPWISQVERISYPTHHGDSPTSVEFVFSAPSDDLNLVPETVIEQEFATDELLSIHGALALSKRENLMPLVVKFIEDTPKGDLILNSTVLGEFDPNDIEIKINAPKRPGKYRIWIGWGSDTVLIGRAKVIVRRK